MAKTKNELLAEALISAAKYVRKKGADGQAVIHYFDVLKEWYNAPETEDSGSNPGGNPPPPPPGP